MKRLVLNDSSRATLLLAAVLQGAGTAHAEAAGDVTGERLRDTAAIAENWLVNGGNSAGQHFSALEEIDTDTVVDLGLAWSLDIPVRDGIAATPLVVDGTIYLSGPYSVVFAVDAANGRTLWQYDPDVRAALADDPYLSWPARSNRGVAVWDGLVIVATADCRLVALHAEDGKPAWEVRACDPEQGYRMTDAPRVGGGKVFVGNAGSESGKKNRGYVAAYDAATGKLLWRFYTVPSDDPAENDTPALKMAAETWTGDRWQQFGGGGSVWNEMTYDPDANLLYFGTAGALPYVHRLRSPDGGDNLFLSSIVAVDADSGEYRWHYQTVPGDSWEYNATMNIVLAELVIGDEPRKVLMIAPKNGFFYILDRQSGELISAEKFVRVNWATQINSETGRPVLDPAGRYWEADAGATVALWPNMWGAHGWNPMAYHPGLKLAYIPAIDIPSVINYRGEGDFDDTLDLVTEVEGKAHSPGKLIAWDPLKQRLRWHVDHELPFNGGVLATGGDLVFQGDATGRFAAYHAATGERLWSTETGSAINSAPVTFELRGRQYVLVAIGAGGGAQFLYPELHATETARGPARLLAFARGGDAPMPRHEPPAQGLPDVPEPVDDPDTIARGRALYEGECGYCHGRKLVARHGGSVPDLRFAGAGVHEAWNGIVLGGARRAAGMPGFDLSPAEAEAIRQYVLHEAARLRREMPD